jgi:hypothetical protein
MSVRLRSKQIGEHRTGCFAVEAAAKKEWRSPWGCIDWSEMRGGAPRVWLDARGRNHQHPGTTWLRYVCNDIQCKAILLVCETDVADAADALRSSRRS